MVRSGRYQSPPAIGLVSAVHGERTSETQLGSRVDMEKGEVGSEATCRPTGSDDLARCVGGWTGQQKTGSRAWDGKGKK